MGYPVFRQPDTPAHEIERVLDVQRRALRQEKWPSADIRKDRLRRAIDLLRAHKDDFIRAISEDFGHRSTETTLFTDVYPSIMALKQALEELDKWMKPERRKLRFPLPLMGAKARIMPQPKGVVGLITPWNFPLTMVFVPLAQMLAAGNRVMIKPSEQTPRTSTLLARVLFDYFGEDEVAVFTGGVETSSAFAQQPFDHLMFTGSTAVGRKVMMAASQNLTPVTLELGGKSPVVVSKGADIAAAAERVATMKCLNAGQICLAPDYVLLDESIQAAFLSAYREAVARLYPEKLANDDYTAIINAGHRSRLNALLEDARRQGAEVEYLATEDEVRTQAANSHVTSINTSHAEGASAANQSGAHAKLLPALVHGVTPSMRIMQDEIFGPYLPVRTFKILAEAVEQINAGPRPLALYYFGPSGFGADQSGEDYILHTSWSGGVTVNDCLFHGVLETMPFGGVGASGMGRYHGYDGFKEFSHMKPVLKHPKASVARLFGIVPPYGKRLRMILKHDIGI